jgi:tetratricopeptide (TPR) repeat protein
VTRAQGACDQAAPLLEEAVALFEEIGDPGWIASARGNLGILAYWRGDPGHGAALLEGAVYLYRQAGDRYPYGAAVALSDLALVTCDRGDHARAATLFAESLARWREVGTREG